jgi:hypothetical protein
VTALTTGALITGAPTANVTGVEVGLMVVLALKVDKFNISPDVCPFV